jgi:3-hydroxyisobutyrate dehydrogenase-like beta-hydroxyacid dehydrogenase
MEQVIGLIGLGNAGLSVGRGLQGKAAVIGCDRDPLRKQAAVEFGITCVDTVTEVAATAGPVILSLPKPEISLAVIDEILTGEKLPDVIIETSTIAPHTAKESAARCRARGVAYVDAAIAGGVASMAAAKITFFLGGDPDDVAKAKPVLDLLAERIFELGPIGAGMGAKVVNNGVMHAVMVVLIEAFAMSTKLGVPTETMIDILKREDGLMRPLQHRVQERIKEGDYEGGMSVSNARKDSVLALETAQDLQVPLFATLAAHSAYEIAEAKGLGDLDYAALAQLWEDWAGVSFKDDGA